jgi:aryl-alcohol dehydrogenase-like predicted oxidoreductase
VIETAPFGTTGHDSTRILFGAAALGAMRQDRADAVLETLLEFGINHIDCAARYGDAELRLAPWMQRHRDRFFLATKTGDRRGDDARRSLEQSLARMQVDQIDLIQLHNLVDEEGWQAAFAPGGAVEALAQARDEGLVRFVGVTGHGTRVAAMHLRSLERFAFDSVLLPCNFSMMNQPDYAADFDALVTHCQERGVAIQTIKSIARRRWEADDTTPHYSWYEPLRDPEAIRRAVHFVLRRPGLFLNTSSDATLLRTTLEAAAEHAATAGELGAEGLSAEIAADVTRHDIQPLFIPGLEGI